MKKPKALRPLSLLLVVALAPLFQGQISEQQRKELRELLRYQRAYNEQLDQAREQLLEKDEELQVLFGEMADAEQLYLELSRKYETLLNQKMAADPTFKDVQAKLAAVNERIRKVGNVPRPR